MFIRKRSGANPSGSKKGCDFVEMYFDPSGKENVTDRMLQEGYYVVRRENSDIGEGDSQRRDSDVGREWEGDSRRRDSDFGGGDRMGTELTEASDKGLESGNGTYELPTQECDAASTAPPSRMGRGLMSMVTSALQLLEMESA